MKNKNKVGFISLIMVAILLITVTDLNAQDWPRWRGVNNDGVSKETGLNLDWTAKKPPLAWTFKQAGAGYASPVIVGTTLYCQGAANGKDFAFALDTQTGVLKWKQELGEMFENSQGGNRGAGARGSITFDGNRLYLIRGAGQIHCISATDGKMIWQKEFVKDFGGKLGSGWGYSESPLVDGNLVICTPGGENGMMIALDKNTGNLVWRTKEWTETGGYSSAIVAEVGGIRQYIQQANRGVAGISAKDGKVLWKVDYPNWGRVPAVIPTPVFHDNFVYVTNGYNTGCMGIKLTKAGEGIKADTIYTHKRDIASQHGGVVLINGYIYGHSDRPSDSWVCQNFKTGEIVWNKPNEAGTGKGAVIGVGDRLLLLDERTGTITVAAASPNGWKDFGRMEIPQRSNEPSNDNMVWTHLVIADGKLYLRDHELLFCFDLKK